MTYAPRLVCELFTGPMWSGKTSSMVRAVQAASNVLPSGVRAPLASRSGVVVPIKHVIDTRTVRSVIEARTRDRLEGAVAVPSLDDVKPVAGNMYVIDEAQFFGGSLLAFWQRLHAAAVSGSPAGVPASTWLYVAGLDLDFRNVEFGSLLALHRMISEAAGVGSTHQHATTSVNSVVPGRGGAGVASVAGAPRREASPLSISVRLHRLHAWCSHGNGACNRPAAYSQRLANGGAERIKVGGDESYQPACDMHHRPHPVDSSTWMPALTTATTSTAAVDVEGEGEARARAHAGHARRR
jgi:thymidine kinase